MLYIKEKIQKKYIKLSGKNQTLNIKTNPTNTTHENPYIYKTENSQNL